MAKQLFETDTTQRRIATYAGALEPIRHLSIPIAKWGFGDKLKDGTPNPRRINPAFCASWYVGYPSSRILDIVHVAARSGFTGIWLDHIQGQAMKRAVNNVGAGQMPWWTDENHAFARAMIASIKQMYPELRIGVKFGGFDGGINLGTLDDPRFTQLDNRLAPRHVLRCIDNAVDHGATMINFDAASGPFNKLRSGKQLLIEIAQEARAKHPQLLLIFEKHVNDPDIHEHYATWWVTDDPTDVDQANRPNWDALPPFIKEQDRVLGWTGFADIGFGRMNRAQYDAVMRELALRKLVAVVHYGQAQGAGLLDVGAIPDAEE